MWLKCAALFLLLIPSTFAQNGPVMEGAAKPDKPLLTNEDADRLAVRMVQLMESTAAALPELLLASAPMVGGAKNTLATLRLRPGNAPVSAEIGRRVRAFLAIADATPKPVPFSEAARKQFAELREGLDRWDAHFDALIADKELQIRNPDPDNLKRYAEANARVLSPGVNPRVVFLGDSITDFWRLNEYFTGRDFINRGISGQVTTQMLGRFKADVIDLKPKAVLMLAGTNDIARGTALAAIENNILMMCELARVHQIQVLIASVLPAGRQQTARPVQTIQQLNSWLASYCSQTGCVYVDYASKVRDATGYLQTELADDGLHPNSQGYRVMAPVALAAIDRVAGVGGVMGVVPARKRKVRLP